MILILIERVHTQMTAVRGMKSNMNHMRFVNVLIVADR